MKVKLSKCLEKGIAKFNKPMPVAGDEYVEIKCPVCKKIYRPKGNNEKEICKPYNNACKHIVLHLAPLDMDEAIIDKGKIYDHAEFMNEQINGSSVDAIALALCQQQYPNQIAKAYSMEGCHGEACAIGYEFIVFSKE